MKQVGLNKKGQEVSLSPIIAASINNTCILDGEQIGEMYYVFDILSLDGKSLKDLPTIERLKILSTVKFGPAIEVVPTAYTRAEKQALFDRIKAENGEGVVFKRKDTPYKPGRPNSGGDHFKFKFRKTATFIVANMTPGKRSVGLEMVDENDTTRRVFMGKVTIPPNKEIPSVGDLVEVKYLYTYRGGAVFQPVYLGVRNDQDLTDATTKQLVYKQGQEEEEEMEDGGEAGSSATITLTYDDEKMKELNRALVYFIDIKDLAGGVADRMLGRIENTSGENRTITINNSEELDILKRAVNFYTQFHNSILIKEIKADLEAEMDTPVWFQNGGDVTKMKIIGRVTTEPMTFTSYSEGKESGTHTIEGTTYDVVSIFEERGHKYYVTNHWHKEWKKQPLVIVDTIAEKYEPIMADGGEFEGSSATIVLTYDWQKIELIERALKVYSSRSKLGFSSRGEKESNLSMDIYNSITQIGHDASTVSIKNSEQLNVFKAAIKERIKEGGEDKGIDDRLKEILTDLEEDMDVPVYFAEGGEFYTDEESGKTYQNFSQFEDGGGVSGDNIGGGNVHLYDIPEGATVYEVKVNDPLAKHGITNSPFLYYFEYDGKRVWWHGEWKENKHKFTKFKIVSKDATRKEPEAEPEAEAVPMTPLQESLSKMRVEGNVVYLPKEMLSNYNEVRDALIKAGASYKRNTFVFPREAQPYMDRLLGGEKINLKKQFQYFGTPARLADKVVQYAEIKPGEKVLEPSAGQGAIVDAVHRVQPDIIVDVFELMEENRDVLLKKNVNYLGEDFSKIPAKYHNYYDSIVANPPFNKNQDIDHIRKMYECLKKGGRLVSIASTHWKTSSNKKESEFRSWLQDVQAYVEDIPAGEFKESGTGVTTCIITIDKIKKMEDGGDAGYVIRKARPFSQGPFMEDGGEAGSSATILLTYDAGELVIIKNALEKYISFGGTGNRTLQEREEGARPILAEINKAELTEAERRKLEPKFFLPIKNSKQLNVLRSAIETRLRKVETPRFRKILTDLNEEMDLPVYFADGGEADIPVMDEETYLSVNGASRQDIGDSALHKNKGSHSDKTWSKIVDAQAKKDTELVERRQVLREEYQRKIAAGELRAPTRMERLVNTAKGMDENESVQAARRILTKQGVDWTKMAQGGVAGAYNLPELYNGGRIAAARDNDKFIISVKEANIVEDYSKLAPGQVYFLEFPDEESADAKAKGIFILITEYKGQKFMHLVGAVLIGVMGEIDHFWTMEKEEYDTLKKLELFKNDDTLIALMMHQFFSPIHQSEKMVVPDMKFYSAIMLEKSKKTLAPSVAKKGEIKISVNASSSMFLTGAEKISLVSEYLNQNFIAYNYNFFSAVPYFNKEGEKVWREVAESVGAKSVAATSWAEMGVGVVEYVLFEKDGKYAAMILRVHEATKVAGSIVGDIDLVSEFVIEARKMLLWNRGEHIGS